MITITVGGPPGSGTSTVCRMLEEELGIRYIYAGQIFREKARSLGLSLQEFGDLCEKDPRYDKELDEDMMELARKGDVLVEGRMIGPLCNDKGIRSFKIYIDADPAIRAERLMERDGGPIKDVIENMKEREESEAQRYLAYYNIDPRDRGWYDLVIDSTNITPQQEMDIIIEGLKRTE